MFVEFARLLCFLLMFLHQNRFAILFDALQTSHSLRRIIMTNHLFLNSTTARDCLLYRVQITLHAFFQLLAQ